MYCIGDIEKYNCLNARGMMYMNMTVESRRLSNRYDMNVLKKEAIAMNE